MLKVREKTPTRIDEAQLEKLAYKTPVEYNGCYYIKVNKHQLGQGVKMEWPTGSCVLFNIKCGTFRAVKSSTVVRVLEVDACVSPGVARDHFRSYSEEC